MTDKEKLGYISACADYETEQVLVWERGPAGRKMIRYDAPYYFYVEDSRGEYTSLFGHTLTRLDFDCKAEFEAAKFKHEKRFESDINPTAKVLMNEYYQAPTPTLNYTFLDIEVDYDRNIGFSSPENPYAPINAITLYHQWLDEFITIAVPPKGWKGDILKQFDELMPEIKTNLIIAKDEAELLYSTLDLIDDSDLLSGWNSEFFDLPYLLKRTEMVLGRKAMNRWCFLGALPPRFDTVERFGKEQINASLSGRIHLDYLALFKKFTFEGRVSFSLGAIAGEELDIPKLEYEGTLEDLYKNDFIHFIKYNVRDTEILKRLDQKFKFIALANQMSHENTVPVEAVLGTVKYVETGIINYVHNEMHKVMPDKITRPNSGKVEGAIVMTPKVGLHEWVGSVDINSLYPSVIRSLNISSEKIIGQFTSKEDDWRGIWKKDDKIHVLEMENLDTYEATGAEWYNLLKQKQWAVSAYGTVFDQSSGQGAVAAVLTAWFAARKDLQKKKKEWSIKLKELIKSNAPEAEIAEAEKNVAHYDLLQHTKKISLNSAYGALLNAFFAFFDERMGASVTASGRQITTHMIETAGEILTGARDQLVKTTSVDKKGKVQHDYHIDSLAIIYSDTDSLTGDSLVYVNGHKMQIADLYDSISEFKLCDNLNKSFVKPAENLKLYTMCSDGEKILEKSIRYVMKHLVKKEMFKITVDHQSVIITEDHSAMVMRNSKLIAVKAKDIQKTDKMLNIKLPDSGMISSLHLNKTDKFEVQSLGIQELDVYDIEVDDVHNFFANDILVHNSCYYQTFTTDKEGAVEIADAVANGINDSFGDFMREAFLCTPGYDDLIKAARELVGERALFQAKKKYVIKVVDLEGAPVNKLKSMGSEVKKSDTPKIIQNFLKQVLQQILDGKSYSELEKFINESRYGLLRNSVSDSDLISIGVSKAVNNLDKFYDEWKIKEKSGLGRAKLPGHVRASINYNEMALENEGNGASLINSGDKVLIYYLDKNDRNLESIAIPAEMTKFPAWFSQFKINVKKTEEKMIDSKLEGIFSALGQEVPTPYGTHLKNVLVF